jgi:hypothetical protein
MLFDQRNWIFDTKVFNDLYGCLDDEEGIAFLPEKLRKARDKNDYSVEDSYTSVFYRTYLLPSIEQDSPIRDPTNSIGRKFQRSFRVPFCVFEDICSDIKRVKSLPGHSFDAKGAESVCISLLV